MCWARRVQESSLVRAALLLYAVGVNSSLYEHDLETLDAGASVPERSNFFARDLQFSGGLLKAISRMQIPAIRDSRAAGASDGARKRLVERDAAVDELILPLSQAAIWRICIWIIAAHSPVTPQVCMEMSTTHIHAPHCFDAKPTRKTIFRHTI